MQRVATLQEIESYYTLSQLLDLHDALDAKLEAEKEAATRN